MNIGIKDILYGLRYFLIPYVILACICLFIKLNFTKDEIYFAVNSRHTNWQDVVAPYVTDIGNGWTTVAISAIMLLFSYRKAFLLASSYVMTGLIFAQIVKFMVKAPRPKLYFANRLKGIYFVKGTEQLSFHSFPSGHTVTAFSTAIVILYLLKNKSWGLLLLLVAVCVGYSRMYLSQHFFEDVTIGSGLGVIVTVFWLKWIDSKQFLHTAKWNRGLLKKS
ncbi:MAG TPA: phosphatase PAP2 family protein [Mucilaginibacter sp.]